MFYQGSLLILGLLASSQFTHGATTARPQTTSQTQTTTSVQTQTTAGAQTQTTTGAQTQTTTAVQTTTSPTTNRNNDESFRTFISKVVNDAVAQALLKLMDSIDLTTTAKTTAAETSSSSTTVDSSSANTGTTETSTAASSQSGNCPKGEYDREQNLVTFTLEDKECQITVYLDKPPKKGRGGPKRGKGPKGGKKTKHGKKGKDKNVVAGPLPGSDVDMCPEITTRSQGKEYFMIETGDCALFVMKIKSKGRGKDEFLPPTIFSQPM